MAENLSNSHLAILERDRTALSNAENQAEIAGSLAELGVGPDNLQEGRSYWDAAWAAVENSRVESTEAILAHEAFDKFRKGVDARYTLMRKKIKVAFRKEPLVLDILAVSSEKPRTYLRWLDGVRTCCNGLLQKSEYLVKLEPLKVTRENIEALLSDCNQLDDLRSGYLKEKGESQHATKVKDEAMLRLDDWMRDFYAIAKIALEDKPQLLESLGIYVKS
jgi:hypothetical protein